MKTLALLTLALALPASCQGQTRLSTPAAKRAIARKFSGPRTTVGNCHRLGATKIWCQVTHKTVFHVTGCNDPQDPSYCAGLIGHSIPWVDLWTVQATLTNGRINVQEV